MITWVLRAVLVGGAGAIAVAATLSLTGSAPATPSHVTVVAQQGAVLSTVSATGNLQAAETVGVDFAVSGRVASVKVKVGDRVGRGQVLATLDAGDALRAVVSAQASLAQAEAQATLDLAGPNEQSRVSAENSVKAAEASLASAQQSLKSTQMVNATNIANSEQQLAAAREQLATAKEAGGTNPQALASARSAVTSARQNLSAALASLADAKGLDRDTVSAAEQSVRAAQVELAAGQKAVSDAEYLMLIDCGHATPTVNSDTSSKCRGSIVSVDSARRAAQGDASSLEATQLALNQTVMTARQNERQSAAQVASSRQSLTTAKKSLAALQVSNRRAVEESQRAVALAQKSLDITNASAAQSGAQAEAQVQSASVTLANTKAVLAALDEPVSAAQGGQEAAQVVIARTQVGSARAALRHTTLRAPVAATVTAVNLTAGLFAGGGGSTSAAGSGPITLTQLIGLQVTAAVNETDALRIRPGQPATVSVDALGGEKFAGHVVTVAPTSTIVSNVVTYDVVIALDSSQGNLKPGVTVAVDIVVGQRLNVVNVPTAAVRAGGSGSFVIVLNGSEQVQVPVITGLQGDATTQITSGIRAGQLVVLPTVKLDLEKATGKKVGLVTVGGK